jgi:hypothetical protein
MIVTEYTKKALAYRRQKRKMEEQGFIRLAEPYWPIIRGDQVGRRITKVMISTDGTSLYIKLSRRKSNHDT